MDDMQAIEQRITRELHRRAGPSEPVDDAAIFTAITATTSLRWRFQSMFSAAKFVTAGAIVALFGGFLLAGLLTQPSDDTAPAAVTVSPSPTTTEEPLSGVVTEEVEPGVYRVVDDGAGHDLVAEPPAGLSIGSDGSVWLLRAVPESPSQSFDGVDAVYELGRDGTFPFSPATNSLDADLAVGADGVAWLNVGADGGGGVLAALDGSTWSSPTWPDGAEGVGAIEATPDGAVWVIEEAFDPGARVARIVDGEWTVLPPLDDPSLASFFDGDGPGYTRSEGGFRQGYLAASGDGSVWLAAGGHQASAPHTRIGSSDGLLHFDGARWEVVDLPPGGIGVVTGKEVRHPLLRSESKTVSRTQMIEGWLAGPLAVGTDGTLWVYLEKPGTRDVMKVNDPQAGYLARLGTDGWTLFSATADDVPKMVIVWGPEAAMAVDGTGTLWVGHYRDGVLAFDGSEWRQYLPGLDVNRLGVAPDGRIFATALSGCDPREAPDTPVCQNPDLERAGLYVITPEAGAAKE